MGKPADRGEVYCTDCGELMDAGARYCAYCGEPMRENVNRAVMREEQHQDQPPSSYIPEGQQTSRSPGQREQTGRGPAPRPRQRESSEPTAPRLRAVGVSFGVGLGAIVLLSVVALLGIVIGIILQLPFTGMMALGAVMGYTLGFLGLGILYMTYRGYNIVEMAKYIGMRTPEPQQLAYVLAGNVAIVLVLAGFLSVINALAGLPDSGAASELAQGEIGTALYLGIVAFMLVIVGPAEEIIFRGVIQTRLREQFSVVPAIVLSSLIFTVLHIQIYTVGGGALGAVIGFTALFVPALIFGYLFERTGNVLVPSLIHGIHNSMIVTILVYGPDYMVNIISI